MNSFFTKYKKGIGYFFCFLFILVTLPSLLQRHHELYNLEPYPDGLLYALSARNLVLHGELSLVYAGSQIQFWVPPLYSLSLSLGYLISQKVVAFFLVNILLGVGSCLLLWHTILNSTKNHLIATIALFLYLSHGYILWLPTLPMSENASIFCMLLALYGLSFAKPTYQSLLITLFGVIGILATRFSLVLPASALFIWWTSRVIQSQPKRILSILFSVFFTFCALFFLYLSKIHQNPIAIAQSVAAQFLNSNGYYSSTFTTVNSTFYMRTLFGFKTQFLWQYFPLTSGVLTTYVLIATGVTLYYTRQKSQIMWLIIVAAFHIPLLLIFYVADARYIITILPIIVILGAIAANFLQTRYPLSLKKIVLVILFLSCAQLYSQYPFIRKILSANTLGTTHAWQYEAVLNFNTFAQNFQSTATQPPAIITALPPFLVDAYQEGNYRVLPLSQHQEFLAKKEYVWGEDVPYGNLLDGYEQWLKEGKRLYISNSYITHQASVTADFEAFKERFTLTEVQSGCLNACTIFELHTRAALPGEKSSGKIQATEGD